MHQAVDTLNRANIGPWAHRAVGASGKHTSGGDHIRQWIYGVVITSGSGYMGW